MERNKSTEEKTALLAGLLIGFFLGAIAGGVIAYKNFVEWDLHKMKDEVRISVKEMKMEQIQIDELIDKIREWQMEVDEIWLYYGDRFRTRAMASDEGRPSKGD